MRHITKLVISAAFAGITMAASAADGWMDNVDDALAKAKTDKKPVMVEFTGSDWCAPCIMMRKEVFGKKEFVGEASKNFILVTIDTPMKDKELNAKNRNVRQAYRVMGVPTVILFTPEGKEFDRFNPSKYNTVEKFLAHLDKVLAKKEME